MGNWTIADMWRAKSARLTLREAPNLQSEACWDHDAELDESSTHLIERCGYGWPRRGAVWSLAAVSSVGDPCRGGDAARDGWIGGHPQRVEAAQRERPLIIGVCAGAKIVGEAGLLDGTRATPHWYYVEELRKDHHSIRYVPGQRVVVNRGVATTTGITASIPIALTVIEAIAGREKAEAVWPEIEWELNLIPRRIVDPVAKICARVGSVGCCWPWSQAPPATRPRWHRPMSNLSTAGVAL
jgi:hypothetical protein